MKLFLMINKYPVILISCKGFKNVILQAIASPNITDVFIDEIKFLDKNILPVIQSLLIKGINVSAVGLNLDSNGIPFGSIPALLEQADDIQIFSGQDKKTLLPTKFTALKMEKLKL